jgi:hypothetical protein
VAIEVHDPQIREAEDAILSGGVSVRAEDGAAGKYTGTGYVGGFDGKAGGTVQFVFDADVAQNAELYVVNDIPTGDFNDVPFSDIFTIAVNGNPFATDAIQHVESTGWFAFTRTDLGEISLNEGKNTISFISINAITNMDSICLSTAAVISSHVITDKGQNYVFEAENADSNAWATNMFWKMGPDSENAGSASGNSYVGHIGDVKGQKDANGDYYYFLFNVYAKESATAVFYLQAGIPAGLTLDADFPLSINNETMVTGFSTSGSGGWTVWAKFQVGEFTLQTGLNAIRFDDVNTLMNFDCLIINSPAELSSSAFVG